MMQPSRACNQERFLQKWYAGYLGFLAVIFVVFLMATLCFGRAFSVQKLGVLMGVPLYVTDAFLVLALPALLPSILIFRREAPLIFWPFWGLLILGFIHLGYGLCIDRDPLALRGVVLSSYMFFLPLTCVLLTSDQKPERAFWFLILCNVVNIATGFLVMISWRDPSFADTQAFIQASKGFNLTLYYGMTAAFLFVYSRECRRTTKLLVWFLLAVNIYLIVVMGVRSAWFALFIMVAFFLFLLRFRFWKVFGAFFVIACCVAAFLKFLPPEKLSHPLLIPGKLESLQVFVSNIVKTPAVEEHSRGAENSGSQESHDAGENGDLPAGVVRPIVSPAASEAYDNITWRLRIWGETLREGLRSPVLGCGFVRQPDYKAVVMVQPVSGFQENSGITPPHNEFLTVFYKMGFLGLGLFLWLNIVVFIRGLRAIAFLSEGVRRALLTGALGAFMFWHAMAQFFDVIDSPPTNIFLWVLLGAILSLTQHEKREG